jgi:hypothetical protein
MTRAPYTQLKRPLREPECPRYSRKRELIWIIGFQWKVLLCHIEYKLQKISREAQTYLQACHSAQW